MSPYATEDEQVWPGVVDEVPPPCGRCWTTPPSATKASASRPSPSACGARPATPCGGAYSAIDFPAGHGSPDGSGFLFHLLTDRSPETVQAHFEDYYERPVPLDAVRHVLAGRPMTPAMAAALGPAGVR